MVCFFFKSPFQPLLNLTNYGQENQAVSVFHPVVPSRFLLFDISHHNLAWLEVLDVSFSLNSAAAGPWWLVSSSPIEVNAHSSWFPAQSAKRLAYRNKTRKRNAKHSLSTTPLWRLPTLKKPGRLQVMHFFTLAVSHTYLGCILPQRDTLNSQGCWWKRKASSPSQRGPRNCNT